MSPQSQLKPPTEQECIIYLRALDQLITELKTAQRFLDSYLHLLSLNLTTLDEQYEVLIRHRSCSESCIHDAYVKATAFNSLFLNSGKIGQELHSIWSLIHSLYFYIGDTNPLKTLLNSVISDLNIYRSFSDRNGG